MSVRGELAASGARICAPLLVFLALLSPLTQASEPKSRIRYAEPAQIPVSQLPRSSEVAQAGAPARLVFDAYGRRFDLELESNDRLLRRLSATRRSELPPHDLYRGRVAGLPGSWVRLTRLPDGLYGAIWDGNEFYSIAPAHALAEFLGGVAPRTSEQPLVYRAADVDVLTGPGFCLAIEHDGSAARPTTGSDQYRALLQELRQSSAAAAIATRELDVAMIGDFEFFSQETDPLGELLSRLNVVDGIFSEQVGVLIAASELKVFDNSADPFTTNDAETLLDQVGSYRVATPAIAATGLAHLVTGRDLIGSTVGIAYIAGVCEARFGVSLSERFTDPFFSALIAAHEFGHNFGAPHDAESGSPCQNTGFGFLMSPSLNGSSTFSQCSLDQMAPLIAASSCIAARKYVDVAIELPVAALSGHTRIAERLSVDLASIGTVASNGTTVDIALDGSVSIVVASVEGGTCTSVSGGLTCQLGQIPAGQRRRMELDLTGSRVGVMFGSVRAAATNDADDTNNERQFQLALDPATDAAIRAEPEVATILNGDELVVSYVVSVGGIQALSRAAVETFPGTFQILSATPQSGTCSVTARSSICELGNIAPGASRRVTLRVRSTTAGASLGIGHRLTGTTDDTGENNTAAHEVRVSPLVDLVVRAEPADEQVQRGTSVARSFTVLSIGPRAAREARLRLSWPNTLEVRSISAAGATCTVLNENFGECVFQAPLESGGTRRADLSFVAVGVGSASVVANVSSPDNEHFDGPLGTSAASPVDVRESADVELHAGLDVNTYDSHPFRVNWRVWSGGLAAVDAATLDVSLPAGVVASEAVADVGSCAISTSSVRCQIGSLPPNRFSDIEMTLQALMPGSYTLSATAGAANDADPDNNATITALDIVPNIDVSVDPLPEVVQAKIGRTIRYAVTVSTASHPVDNVLFWTAAEPISGQYELLSVTASQGVCELVDGDASCTLGTMAARTTARIDLELRGVTTGTAVMRVSVDGANVINLGRKWRQASFIVMPIGNAAVAVSPTRIQRSVGDRFAAPVITVESLSETEDVSLEVSVPQGLAVERAAPDIGTCEVGPTAVICDLGALATGERRTLDLELRAVTAGTYTARVEALTDDDSDPADNATTFEIDVQAPAAPPAPPSGSGGGGGGSLDWSSLVLAALGLGLCRRRRGTAIRRTRQVHSGRCPDGRGLAH